MRPYEWDTHALPLLEQAEILEELEYGTKSTLEHRFEPWPIECVVKFGWARTYDHLPGLHLYQLTQEGTLALARWRKSGQS